METDRRTSFLISIATGFVGAILLSSFVFISPLVSLLILIIGIAIVVGERLWSGSVEKEVWLVVIFLIAFGLGGLRYAVKDFHEVVVPSNTGIVVSEPEDKDNSRRFIFLSDNGEKVLVSLPLYNPVEYGDRINVTGKLERPGIIKDLETLREFDYGKYLAKDDIYYTLGFAEVELISSGHGNELKSALFKLKRSFVNKAKDILPEPHASLLTGLIVSGKDAMPKNVLDDFRKAGVIHIVVLSGFNITLIADFLRRVFQSIFIYAKLPAIPQAAAGASIAGIILFVIMTGAEATVVRAAIMALIVITAGLIGREYSATRALMVAGILMLVENPKILIFDPSFQLSFLATLGLIYLMKPIEKCLSRVVSTKWEKIREITSQTLATQLAVLPLLIYSTGGFSPVFLPANILTLLVVPWTMLVGFLAILVSFVSTIIALPLTYMSHILLSWILLVASLFGSL